MDTGLPDAGVFVTGKNMESIEGDDEPRMAIVKPWVQQDSILGAHSGERRIIFLDRIREAIEPRAIQEAFEFVERPGQLMKLRLQDESLAAKFLLTSPSSPCFQQPVLGELLERVRRRLGSAQARADALEWLDLFLAAFTHNDNFCRIEARKTFLNERSDLITILWDLATDVPSQYRFLSELKKRRDQLVTGGVPDAALRVPEWLMAASNDAEKID